MLTLALMAAVNARAQGPEPDAQAGARKEMRLGVDAFGAKDYEEALQHFRRAMQLVPEANVPHRFAAQALEGLSRWEEAVSEYEAYLHIKEDVSDAATIKKRVEEIRAQHLQGVLKTVCDPLSAEISTDDGPPASATSGELRLRAGAHHIRVTARGYTPREQDVVVPAGGSTQLDCKLEREAPLRGPDAALQPVEAGRKQAPPASSSSVFQKWWFWTGAAVLAAGVGVTIGVVAAGGSRPPPTEGGNHSFP
jgi:tetratricopeptide (TPR) repeat protein